VPRRTILDVILDRLEAGLPVTITILEPGTTMIHEEPDDLDADEGEPCPDCDATGVDDHDNPCEYCNGTGTTPT
jgi:RecJ-like exonuclease